METDFLDIIAGLLQGDTLAPYLFIFCPDYVLQMLLDLIKENDFMLKKEKKQTILVSTRTQIKQRTCFK